MTSFKRNWISSLDVSTCKLLVIIVATGLAAAVASAGPLERAENAYHSENYEVAYKIWLQLAVQENAVAQNNLGYMLNWGRGLQRNKTQAVMWFERAAKQGLKEAQFNFGSALLWGGYGITRNESAGIVWIRAAANQGVITAQISLAIAYENGHGVPRNLTETFRWLQAAAVQGGGDAQLMLGQAYAEGRGVPKSREQAIQWYFKAAAKRSYHAITRLEKLGVKVPKRYSRNVGWQPPPRDSVRCCIFASPSALPIESRSIANQGTASINLTVVMEGTLIVIFLASLVGVIVYIVDYTAKRRARQKREAYGKATQREEEYRRTSQEDENSTTSDRSEQVILKFK